MQSKLSEMQFPGYLLQFPQELDRPCSGDIRPVEEGEAAAVDRERVMRVRVICRTGVGEQESGR